MRTKFSNLAACLLLLWGFVILHSPTGKRIFINPNEVMSIGDPIGGGKGARAEVVVHDRMYYVRETPEEVVKLVEEKITETK